MSSQQERSEARARPDSLASAGASAGASVGPSAGAHDLVEREIGVLDQGRPGPLFFVTGGIHGNEPAGVHAGRRVFAELRDRELPLRGRVVFLSGNRPALARGLRYIDRDLNRVWSRQTIAEVQGTPTEARCSEGREMLALLARFEREIDEYRERCPQVACLDLHTSSAEGPPFSCFGDTMRNRRVAFALPVPAVLGLEETLDGAMLDMFYERGAIAVAVEGGLHDDPAAIARLEDAVWIGLVAAGVLDAADVPELGHRHARLAADAEGLPPVLEVRHREALSEEDEFAMRPGFRSFDHVATGRELATKNGRILYAEEDGFVFLPLYQGKGSDGYFFGRAVRPFWLRVSAALRRLDLGAVLHLLPGVQQHPELDEAFLVNPKVARFFVTEIFHLLGYRHRRPYGDREVYTRRPERFGS
jgi:predicted deacylase